jgi:hypothetical protein
MSRGSSGVDLPISMLAGRCLGWCRDQTRLPGRCCQRQEVRQARSIFIVRCRRMMIGAQIWLFFE